MKVFGRFHTAHTSIVWLTRAVHPICSADQRSFVGIVPFIADHQAKRSFSSPTCEEDDEDEDVGLFGGAAFKYIYV